MTTWSKRSLEGKQYVYVWADGVHFNIRLEGGRQCIPVLMGATAEGKKELIAVADGYRESEQSWKELLLDVKARGLGVEPSLAIGDGALGLWKAIGQIWPSTRPQRCWVHETSNIMDRLPKDVQPRAKASLHGIYEAETKVAAEKAFDLFVATYEAKYPPRQPSAWPRTVTRCWVSTNSRRSTGDTSARPTRSNRRSPRCGCGPWRPTGAGAVSPA
jgi:putative transposase